MRIIAFLCLLMSPYLCAKVVYVGDSIAHGYRTFNHGEGITKVGASPKEVGVMLVRSSSEDSIVLSTGASNNCADIKTIEHNVMFARVKYKNVKLLSAPYCGNEVNSLLKRACKDNCTFVTITPGKDGIHPDTYRSY